jgi:hypothetical protein
VAPAGVGDSLVATVTDGLAGAAFIGLCAVVVTGEGSVVDEATTRGTVVVCTVTGGGSDDCVGGGDATLGGADASVTGAVGGGTSAAVGPSEAFTFGSGTGTAVVVGAIVSVFGLAYAGASPPVSAVNEMTTPDASTAITLRREQISSDAPTCVDSSVITEHWRLPATAAVRSHLPQRWAWTSRCRGSWVHVGSP